MTQTLTLDLPQSWAGVKLIQYQKLDALNANVYKSRVFQLVDILEILTGLSKKTIFNLDVDVIKEIEDDLSWMHEEPQPQKIDKIIIDEIEYRPKKDFKKLTLGEMASIEILIDSEQASEVSSIDIALAVLLREVDDNNELKDFNADNVGELRESIRTNLSITQVLEFAVFFSDGEKTYTENLKDSLKQAKENKSKTEKNEKK